MSTGQHTFDMQAHLLSRIPGWLDQIIHLMEQAAERDTLAAEESRKAAQRNLEAAKRVAELIEKKIPALPDLYVPGTCLSADGSHSDTPDGQALRMEHTQSGCLLVLELPSSFFGLPQPLIGYKLANGAEMIFEYRLTSHGKALFEWLPSPSARLAEQDQQVVWLGGPMPVLGDDK